MAILLIAKSRGYLPQLIYGGLWCLLGLGLVGSYNFALNWFNYSSFFGPAQIAEDLLIKAPSFISLTSNLGRIGYDFFDPGGLPDPLIEMIQQWRPAVGQTVFSVLDIPTNPPGTNFEDHVFSFDYDVQMVPRDDGAWYGPLGFLLFLPTLLFYLLVVKDTWKWSTAFIAFSYIIIFAIFVRWQPWMGRLLLIGVALGAPLMAGFYEWSEKYKPLRWAIILVATVVLSWSATHNYHKPLLGSRTIWNLDYYSLRTLRKPHLAPIYRYIDATVPEDARLGVAGRIIDRRLTYLFFGPNLKRDVVELGPLPRRIDLDFFISHQLDYLVFILDPSEAIDSVAPLWPIIREREEWYMVKRSEVELFSQTTNPDRYRQVFGSDYTAYLAIKEALKSETEPVRVLTIDPRMPYYEQDQRFVFKFTDDLASLQNFTHLVIAPWWSTDDYERLGISVEEMQKFLSQDRFVKKVAETNGYVLYHLLIGNAPSQAISSDSPETSITSQ
jgi:hypothetical protein